MKFSNNRKKGEQGLLRSYPVPGFPRSVQCAVLTLGVVLSACVPALPGDCGETCTLLALNSDPTGTADSGSPTGSFTVSTASLTVAETATTRIFSIRLNQAPTGNVTVPISSADIGEATVSVASLTFTTTNWNIPQPVIVTGVDDAAVDMNQVINIVVGPASSSDSNYSGVDPADVAVTVLDDESPNIIVTETGFGTVVTEGGATDTYTIVLTQAPAANVTVTVTPSAQASANASIVAVPLTFLAGACPGPGNWCTAQVVTVAAIDDAVAEGPHGAGFAHAATSGDGNYNGIAVVNVGVGIIENDKFTFQTAATHNGDFDNDAALGGNGDGSGIAEADAFCLGDANRPSISNYKALLVKPVPAPIRQGSTTPNAGDGQVDWVLAPNMNYYRQDGTTALFTTNASSIFVFGAMTNSFGTAAGAYWTALAADWTTVGGLNCSGWSSTAGNGRTGDATATSSAAIQLAGPPASCATSLPLICVEQ